MICVLVTVKPQMYQQAIAFSIQRQRPVLDVRVASPEATEKEPAYFRPHLLVHNDGVDGEAVADVLCRVMVLYSDGMDARISADGEVFEARDMPTEGLLGIVDRANALAGRE